MCLEKRVLVKLDSQNVCCWASFWGRILSNKACTLLAFLLFQLRRARDAIKVRGGQVRNFAHMKNARCQSYTLENWLESWWWSAFVRLWHTRNYRISCLSNQHFFYFCKSVKIKNCLFLQFQLFKCWDSKYIPNKIIRIALKNVNSVFWWK